MNRSTRAFVRASITATALCGATVLFGSGASAAPADGPLPGVTLPPVTLPPATLPTLPPNPIPLPTLPPQPATPVPAPPATPTIPPVSLPTPPSGGLPTPTLPAVPALPGGGSTPTLPPTVTIPDIPGVGVEVCAELEVAEQSVIDTCVKDATATPTTVPSKKPVAATAKPATATKGLVAGASTASKSSTGGGSGSGGSLARTGSDVRTPVVAGAVLATLGGLAVAASRLLPRLRS